MAGCAIGQSPMSMTSCERCARSPARPSGRTANWTRVRHPSPGRPASAVVAASAASADHHAWSATPWTRRFHLTLRGGAPYHPNAAGMAAVAGLVLTTLETG